MSSPTRCATIARPKPGPLDELGPRPRPPEPDLVEDEDERVERLVGERLRGGPVDVTRRDHTPSTAHRRLLHLTAPKYDGQPQTAASERRLLGTRLPGVVVALQPSALAVGSCR